MFRNGLILLLFFTVSVFAQENKPNPKLVEAELDSLTQVKNNLLKTKLTLNDEIESLLKSIDLLNASLKECMPEFLNRKYGKDIGTRIALGKVWKGMNEEMLLDSWGTPEKVNTNKKKYGVFKQYYYGKIIYFFRDGKLIDWEEYK